MYNGDNFKEFVAYIRNEYEDWVHSVSEEEARETTEEDYARSRLNEFKHVIGKSKIDNTKRVSVISELAEIINASPGDEIEYSTNGTEILFRKVTATYKGYNIEQNLIDERMYDYLAMKWIETDVNEYNKNPNNKPTYEEAKEEYMRMMKNKK